ncbi:YicC/YloC family endoribonuclease [Aestuariivivens sediminicola]|uniref:YicC/YloC family endoribonuclease n=1 Tax=Aestuariivivens sediminicola TaxID=2913560 RepID=UPI001F55DB6F|nr:YicC/YloC family endoribonuclease [Aestuariivivens sediminicola]
MIHSMTGYGKSVLQLPTKKLTIELKSLNSKNLDINSRMPSIYREKELTIRKLLANTLMRGKIDFSIYVETTAEDTSTQINVPVVEQYMQQLKQVVNAEETELLKMAVRFPDALNTVREEIDDSEWQLIQTNINQAIAALTDHRLDEGKVLETDFRKRVTNIEILLDKVVEMDPERVEGIRERLVKGVEELKEKFDENRFEQELIYYIEKLDITEEKVRLKNHLSYFLECLGSKDSNGKKLGFISQEMGREINTIGSKSNFAPMQQLVVQMKDELEKIKEQLLNVL